MARVKAFHHRNFTKTLAEVEEKQGQLADLRNELAQRRGRYHPWQAVEAIDVDRVDALKREEREIGELERAVDELEREVEEAWERALQQQDEAGRLEGDDESLSVQAELLEQRVRALRREREGRHHEDGHERVEQVLDFERERLAVFLAAPVVGPHEIAEICRLWPVRDSALADVLHATVDARTDFAPGSRDAYREQLARLEQAVERRRRELYLRAAEREAQDAEQAREVAEKRLLEV